MYCLSFSLSLSLFLSLTLSHIHTHTHALAQSSHNFVYIKFKLWKLLMVKYQLQLDGYFNLYTVTERTLLSFFQPQTFHLIDYISVTT